MTEQETQQVNTYIQGLQTQFAYKYQIEQKARKMAQDERVNMDKAILEIWKLCHEQSTLEPVQLAAIVRQIIEYYVPDYDIPF
jgi:hypothetical protein